ncbi:MAG TPA: cytochrome c oxidase accessory protein CcoG [Casimicrobiaceae bacterium]|nr:cytochrome c oxidase accessory protein CcoG [Casimicrobiaceae bacterium]
MRRAGPSQASNSAPSGSGAAAEPQARGGQASAPARQPAPASEARAQEIALYEIRQRIHPRAVHGRFAAWRWALVFATQAVFYGLPWLQWNGRQAVLFDLSARRFYIFGAVFWPQDVIYLTALLIIAALSLFLFTAVAGRLWCGYACPQTVYTEIFLWIERKIEGDRPARLRLDAAPWSLEKFVLRATKHIAWFIVALWTGYTFVGYFTPIADLGLRAATWRLGPWEAFWILFYGFATYGNAGFMREQVCKYMCPYARFQSVMFDRDTLVITYDRERGEPRGARSKAVKPRERGLGDCVDCSICVQVCPTGIDIRDGLQYECIGCAACIDGCDQVMDKLGYPRGLIRYATENALELKLDAPAIWRRVLRPRTLVYGGLLFSVVALAAGSLALRNPLKVDVIRDRGTLAREAAPGVIENVYRLQIMNTDEAPRRFEIAATGLPRLTVVGIEQPVAVGAASTRMIALRLRAPLEAAGREESAAGSQVEPGRHEHRAESDEAQRHELEPGPHKVEFVIRAVEDPEIVRHEPTSFIVPR